MMFISGDRLARFGSLSLEPLLRLGLLDARGELGVDDAGDGDHAEEDGELHKAAHGAVDEAAGLLALLLGVLGVVAGGDEGVASSALHVLGIIVGCFEAILLVVCVSLFFNKERSILKQNKTKQRLTVMEEFEKSLTQHLCGSTNTHMGL